MYCKVPLKTRIFAPQLNNKTLNTMKNIVITIASLLTLSASIFAANLDAKYVYKDKGEDEKTININLPEVLIQDVKTGSRMQKAVLINGELVIVHYLPAIEITAEKPVGEKSAMKEIKEVQLPEVVIEGSLAELNYQPAQVQGNQVVASVQLAEVTVTANTVITNNSMASIESDKDGNNKVFNIPAVSVEFALLINIISFLIAFSMVAVG